MEENRQDTVLPHDLIEQFLTAAELLHRCRRRGRPGCAPPEDPYRGQGRVLALLRLQPQITQRELSYLLAMRPQSLGELLAKLERSEYIRRTPDPEDKRVMQIQLTPAGMEAARQVARPPHAPDLFGALSPEEQTALSGELCKAIAALETWLSEHPDAARRPEHPDRPDAPPRCRRHHHRHHHRPEHWPCFGEDSESGAFRPGRERTAPWPCSGDPLP